MRTLILTIFLVFLTTLSFASEPLIDNSKSIVVSSKSVSSDYMSFTVDIQSPQWKSDSDHSDYFSASYSDGSIQNINNMNIPSLSRLFRLPPTGNASLSIVDSDYEVPNGMQYLRDFGLDDSFEYEDRWYPENIMEVSSPAIMNDFRVASLTSFPVQVNPYRNEVRVYNRVEFEINIDDETGINPLPSYPTSISENFIPYYRDFLDWDENELDSYRVYRGNVQVIVQNSAQTLNILEDWFEWKKQKGWNIELLTDDDVDWSRNAIRNELIMRFTSSPEHFNHIVIIGDAGGQIMVPPGSGSGYGAGDHGYSTIFGDDNLFDASVGRISVSSNNELATYVNKVLKYEKHPNLDETDWYKRAVVSAGSVSSGISTVYVCEYARQELYQADYDTVITVYYNDNSGDINSRIIGGLNMGTSFHVYRGFGGTGITNANITSLNNTDMLPVVVDITCNRGNWADGTGVNESYIRAGSPTTTRGAISAISTATGNTHTRFNNALTGGAIEAVLAHKLPCVGDMMNGAKYNLWKNLNTFEYQNVNNFSRWTNLMGDPTVWIWTDIPRPLTVSATDVFELGESTYQVTVEDENGPLENAWVTLYKSDDNEEVIAHSVTDSDGNVLLETPIRFAGDAILTVTASNAEPYMLDVEVSNENQRLALIDFEIIDTENGTTSGNGNGIAEYDETIGLEFTLKNYSSATQNNISVSASSEDPYVTTVSGNCTLGSIAANSEAPASSSILLEIDRNVPHKWLLELAIQINSDQGSYNDVITFEVNAPSLIDAPGIPDETLLPGTTQNVSFNVYNIGLAETSGGNLTLVSNDEWLTVVNNSGTIGPIETASFNTSTEFTIQTSEESFRGHKAKGQLEIEFDNGRFESIPVTVTYGTPIDSDPTGPDTYGYTAYDNSDTEYSLSPGYDWIEINPNAEFYRFPGVDLELRDLGENQDDSEVFDLPFEVKYYGELYDQITVCSNGWMAMGDQSTMALHRNWTIPSPLGPSAMIAPYWDNRILETGGIFYYVDQELDMIIVQWESTLDYLLGAPCTFQAIIYKQDDGSDQDCDIFFQYKDANHSAGESHDVAFWTTGIENPDQNDGLLYAYHNNYEAGSADIDDGRSILFTKRRGLETGTISGYVIDSGNGEAVEGAYISSVFPGRGSVSDENGYFEFVTAAGNFQLLVSHPDFYTDIIEDIEVVSSGNTEIQLDLIRNTFIINPRYMNVIVPQGEEHSFDISLANTGEDTVFFSASVAPYDPETGPQNIGEVHSTTQLSNSYIVGTVRDILFDGTYYWVLNSNGGTSSMLHQVSQLGIHHHTYNLDQFYCELQRDGDDILLIGFREISRYHYDGTDLSEVESQDILMSFNGAAFDQDNEILYLANNTGLRVMNLDGEVLSTLYTGNRVADVCLLEDDPDTKILHFLTYIDSANQYIPRIYRMNPNDSAIEKTFDLNRSYYQVNSSFDIFHTNHENSLIAVYENNWTDMVIDVYEYFPTQNIAHITPETGIIPPGEELTASINVMVENYPVETIENWIVFEHNGFFRREKVHLVVNSLDSDVPQKDNLPQKWELQSIWPNPFNSSAKVKFAIPEQSNVRIELYNILGQRVQTVLNTRMDAGYHSVNIDGSKLASGLYFVKMNSGSLNISRKMVLLK